MWLVSIFFVIGIIWVNHHALLRNIAVVDRTLLFLNLGLLLFVVLIPVATATMAEYLTSGGQDSHVAMVLYGLVLEGMGLSFVAIFGWSLREGRTHDPVAPNARRAALLRFSFGSLAYLVAIVVALFSAPAALGIIALVALTLRAHNRGGGALRLLAVKRPGQPHLYLAVALAHIQ